MDTLIQYDYEDIKNQIVNFIFCNVLSNHEKSYLLNMSKDKWICAEFNA